MIEFNIFKGRITRRDYCYSYLISALTFIASLVVIWGSLYLIERFFQIAISKRMHIASLLSLTISYVILVSSMVRRCHDIGISGWWILIPFYPFLLFFWAPDKEANKYGENPRKF